jgi:hypothetical protein
LNVPGHTRYPGTVHGKQVIEPRQRDIGIGGNLHGSGSSGLGHESQRRAALIVIGGMGDGRRADKGKGVRVGRVHDYGDKSPAQTTIVEMKLMTGRPVTGVPSL